MTLRIRRLHILQACLLLTICLGVTILPEVLLGERVHILIQVIRAGVIIFVLSIGRLYLALNLRNFLLFIFLIAGPYIVLIFMELLRTGFTGENWSPAFLILADAFALLLIVLLLLTYGDKVSGMERPLNAALTPYLYLCLLTAFGGIIVSVATWVGAVNPMNWLAPAWMGMSIQSKSETSLYTAPLYLSLVIYDSTGMWAIPRLSGLSFEPNVAALFAAPALFVIPHVGAKWPRWRRRCAIGLLVVYLTLVSSVTSLLILTVLVALIFLRGYILRKHRTKAVLLASILLTAIVLMLANHWGQLYLAEFLSYKLGIGTGESITREVSRSYLVWLTSAGNFFGDGLFVQGDLSLKDPGILNVLVFGMQLVSALFFSLALFFSHRPTAFIGLSVMYVLLHSLKSPPTILSFTFYFYFLVILAMAWTVPRRRILDAGTTSFFRNRE